MDAIAKHPDILDPYHLGKDISRDRAFAADIGLDVVLSSVPFYSADSRELARSVMIDMNSDLETVQYRQEALLEFLSDADLRGKVQVYVRRLNDLEYKLRGFTERANLESGLALLRSYRESFDHLPDLDSAKSRVLTEVASYLNGIGESQGFSTLCTFLDRMDNSAELVFRVSLDRNGTPVKMYALGLDQAEDDKHTVIAALDRLACRKRHEQSLRGGGGPNQLGRVIQEYADRQFIPIIKACVGQIQDITDLLEPLDFYASFAEFFARLRDEQFDVCRPTLWPREERRMAVSKARNPILLETTSASSGNFLRRRPRPGSEQVVPNDIANDCDKNLFVITGPNNGGKTTYVKTVGLVQLMSQCGLLVPAESADVSFVDGIYTHFVAPEDITKGEGRYRNELRRMKEILEKATPYSLVILDEPCGGTSYEEGLRQSLALLDGFHRLGPAVYFTTHMHLVAKEVDSGRYPAAKNLSVECLDEGGKLTYTYRVKEGASDRSYGEEIAREVGLMPENIMETVSRGAEEKGYGSVLRR